jgi:hypothetical protein
VKDPTKRLCDFNDIKKNPFFSCIDWKALESKTRNVEPFEEKTSQPKETIFQTFSYLHTDAPPSPKPNNHQKGSGLLFEAPNQGKK